MNLSLALGLLSAELVGVLLAIHAIFRPRSAQGAIAWSVALVFAPWIAVPFYLVLGRTRFQGYAEAVREKEKQLDARMPDWYRRMREFRAPAQPDLARMEEVVHQLTGVPFTGGNRVALLIDGEATYSSMLQAIAAAKSYVLVQFYIVRDDVSGRALRDALIERARAGIRVCFLYDEIGSLALSRSYLDAMRREKIEVSGFRTTQGWRNRFQINFRNHRKLLVVDGQSGFIGGLNLGDEYLRYRDTHLRIDGPAAQQIQLTFRKDWFWATRSVLDVSDESVPVAEPGQAVSIITTGPADSVPRCSILFSQLIASATDRVWIASPYFVPDEAMTRSLQAAAKRGVDVRVIVPDASDHRFIELASLTYYAELMACGVRIFRYGTTNERFLHHKVALVDDALAAVGTVNLDYRSLYLNFEETALIADANFSRDLHAMFDEDFRHCRQVHGDPLADQGVFLRVQARIARLASPLL